MVTLILRFLHDEGSRLGATQPVRTALTAPSIWTDAKKKVLQSAAEAAGFDMGTLSLEEEPVAAFEYARTLATGGGSPSDIGLRPRWRHV